MKTCPYCAEEIQDAAVVCKHCSRDLLRTSDVAQTPVILARRSPSLLLRTLASVGAVAIFLLIMAFYNERRNQQFQAQLRLNQQAAQRVQEPHVISIAAISDIDIVAGHIERFNWTIPTNQPRCRLTGRIEVVSGGSQDLQVFVMTPDEFKNQANGHSAKT